MKELSIEQKARAYDDAIKKAESLYKAAEPMSGCNVIIETLFPELKESEDEKIRKELIKLMKQMSNTIVENYTTIEISTFVAWLEKQGTPAKLSEEEQNRFAKGMLTSCALSFINYLDAHKYEGKMCVSNGECEDIENAFHNAMWDRLHRYYCKYIEKQGEKTNPYSGISFEYNGHIWGMCARDNGIDILLDKQLFTHLEKQGEQDNNEDSNILQRFSFYSYKDEPNILYLSGLYVNEECRNKGIGTKILEVADEVAKSLNCHAIRLKTKKDSNAERLYRTHGYNNLATEERDEIWLEKHADKVEPKFHEGEWVTIKE